MPAVGRLNVVGIDAVGYEESEYSVVLVESQMLVPSSCVTVPVAGPVVVKASSISVVVEKPGELSRTELSDVVLAQAVPLQPEIAPPVTNWSSVLAACVPTYQFTGPVKVNVASGVAEVSGLLGSAC